MGVAALTYDQIVRLCESLGSLESQGVDLLTATGAERQTIENALDFADRHMVKVVPSTGAVPGSDG